MTELGLKIENVKENEKELETRIKETYTEEIIIGLCGPIGTNIRYVTGEIEKVISEKFGYEVKIIKLSNFIRKYKNVQESNLPRFEILNKLISAGNELRSEKGNTVLAQLAINEIAVERERLKSKHPEEKFVSNRVCYIIDSIKNNQELELFRLVYTNLFYFIGVFSNLENRENTLEKQGVQRNQVYEIIDRDSGEEITNGQKVTETFNQADFFLRIEQTTSSIIEHKILRFLNLIFSSEIITPTDNETAMYQAFAAAGNSACLSRQVGASITNENGEIISVGWNDVPKYGGSVYSYDETDPLSTKDFRCLNLDNGKCFNDEEKQSIRKNLIQIFLKENLIKQSDAEKAEKLIQNSRIKELIEFSRAVHAEMHAIILAGQKAGHQLKNGKLFCTTYPCHNCARHIVAAGIKEVYYIEPYRKSLALKLHSDAITENEKDDKKLRILLFDGVAPRRYLDFFRMTPNSRKLDGKKSKLDKKTIQPKKTISLQAIPILEKEIIQELISKALITV